MGLDDIEDESSNVEDEERAEAATTHTSSVLLLAKRLLFPTLVLVFVFLYLRNTWGKISFRNLWYPYFIISCTLVLLASIYVTEILDVYRDREQDSATIVEDARETYQEWKLSIWILIIAVVYLYMIDYVGFFPASFVMMAVMMRVGGVNKWIINISICTLTLAFVYIMFIIVLGIRPPSGPIEVI